VLTIAAQSSVTAGMTWDEVVVAYVKVLPTFALKTEKNHERLLSGKQASRTSSESEVFQINWCDKHYTNTFGNLMALLA
jgi:hypothetical protein